ncbi:MAG: hypothetical protein AB7F99_01150 [Vicinamibacterales bacterium]
MLDDDRDSRNRAGAIRVQLQEAGHPLRQGEPHGRPTISVIREAVHGMQVLMAKNYSDNLSEEVR